MKRVLTTCALVLAMAGAAAEAATPGAYSGQKLAPMAKVGLEQAQAIALKARPGEVTDREESVPTGLVRSDGDRRAHCFATLRSFCEARIRRAE